MSPASLSLAHAAALVPDGALVSFGGFDLNRAPIALLRELVARRRRGLRVVTLPNPLALEILAEGGALAEAEFGFLGVQSADGFMVAPRLRRACEEGTLVWRERDVYEIVQGLRAGAAGLPFLPVPGIEGSEYMRVNRTPTIADPDGGAPIAIARPVRPDVVLLHAQEADDRGNLRIDDLYADDLLARAGRRVVATVERLVGRIERPTIPGVAVAAVAHVPGGARPTSCHGHYAVDPAGVRAIVGAPERSDPRPAPAPGETGPADRLVAGMARAIDDGDVVATGVASALPMLAVALARATRAPRLSYINCVGAIDPVIETALPASVDVRLLERCVATITLPRLFDVARQGGIDVMFFGAAQVDERGNLNLTCIGDYERPRVKLPGPAGSASMRPYVRKVVIPVTRQSARVLVPRVDFVTAAPSERNRSTTVVTDLAIFDLAEGRLVVRTRHAGVTQDLLRGRTGFAVAADAPATPEPTAEEMAALRRLDPGGIRHRLI